MDITNQFLILCASKKAITFDSPIPCFCILAILLDMEKNNLIALNDNAEIIINSDSQPHTRAQKILIDAIHENALKDVRNILNHYLRTFTFKELKQIIDLLVQDIAGIDSNIIFDKGKLLIPAMVTAQYDAVFNFDTDDNIMLSSLLYGCRVLKPYMEKQSYREFVAQIKQGITLQRFPLSTFIINNIDLIRGHIMGLVAN